MGSSTHATSLRLCHFTLLVTLLAGVACGNANDQGSSQQAQQNSMRSWLEPDGTKVTLTTLDNSEVEVRRETPDAQAEVYILPQLDADALVPAPKSRLAKYPANYIFRGASR